MCHGVIFYSTRVAAPTKIKSSWTKKYNADMWLSFHLARL
jgi:hypothetical protein